MKKYHLGEIGFNKNGCEMVIVEYNASSCIVVEFQDERKTRVKTTYNSFKTGVVRNPYYPTVCGVGISGNKYPIVKDKRPTKEYNAWIRMLNRCFDVTVKRNQPSYANVTCCDEWLLFDNFYEWLHSQPNFEKWYYGKRWALDKDILIKGNKRYSQDTCCLVPQRVNCLFLKREAERGLYPIGVGKMKYGFKANCHNPFTGKDDDLGIFNTVGDAFNAYKMHKEDIIKRFAQIEYDCGNITRRCFKAMMEYEVEIDD